MADLIDREAVLYEIEKEYNFEDIRGQLAHVIRVIKGAPAFADKDYEQGFKDGLKSECLEELKPLMAKLIEGCTEAIKGITPMLIDNARLTIKADKSRWIPCSDRLPKEVEIVIVCYYGSDVIIPEYSRGETLEEAMQRIIAIPHVTTGFRDEEGWIGADFYPMMVSPTFWMPLPEPPKECESDARTEEWNRRINE